MRKLKSVKSSGRAAVAAKEPAHWTFLSNHAHVLLCLAQTPDMVLREVAGRVGITERAVQKIIADLESGGALSREKIGRQNRYVIHAKLPLRHPIEAHCTIASLLSLVEKKRS
jgi:DNA-binding MarR family transcriptional regulator